MIKKIISIITITCFLQIYTVPEHFDRLILIGPHGNIIKTVDLIGEIHAVFLDLTKRPSKRANELLKKDEQEALTYAERTLIATLREMAQTKRAQPIDVFWELSPDRYEYEKTPVDNFFTSNFIKLSGFKLQKEFRKKQSSLQIVASDTYRSDEIEDIFIPELEFMPVVSATKVSASGKSLFDLLNPKTSSALIHLNQLREKNPVAYAELATMWQSISNELTALLNKYVYPYLKSNPDITLLNLQNQFKKDFNLNEEDLTKLFNNFFHIQAQLFDLETLINIFTTDAKHILVYAGSLHTSNLIKILIEKFNFKPIIQVGFKEKYNSDNEEEVEHQFQIAPSAWEFLKRTPEKSYDTFLKKGPLNKQLDTDYAEELTTILERQDEGRINAMEQWIKKGFAHHINAPNTRIKIDKPILAEAIEKNDIPLTRLLLKYGANANAHYIIQVVDYIEGNTTTYKEAYTTVYEIAQNNNNQEIIDLLIQHGARTEFKRKTPSEIYEEAMPAEE